MDRSPTAHAPGSWPFMPPAALLVAAWMAFCWPWLSGAVTVPWDAKAHFYPQLQFLAQSFANQTGFSWAPFVFSGVPQIADPQSLIFSPPHHILARLNGNPSFAAADAISFLSLLFGAFGVMAYFRDRNWHPAGALVASIAFALGGSAAWRIQHTGQILSLAYFPLVLLFLDRALRRSSAIYGALAGLTAAFMVLGRDQVAGLCALLLAGYVLGWIFGSGWSQRLRAAMWPLTAAALTGIVIIAVPVAMTAVLASQSNRSHIDLAGAGRGSLHPAALLTGFIANLYGTNGEFKEFWGPPSPLWGWIDLYIARNMSNVYSGALVVLTVIFGLTGGVLWRAGARFFGIALALMLLYSLGRYTPFFTAIYTLIPGVDLFRRPADGTFLIGALAAYGAGIVVHSLLTGNDGLVTRGGRMTIAFSLAAVLTSIALAVAKGRLHYAWPMIAEGALWLIAAMALAALAMRHRQRAPMLLAAGLGLFVTLDLIRNNGPNESTALPPSMYDSLRADARDPTMAFLKQNTAPAPDSNRRDRVEIAAIDFHAPNASLVHRLDNTLGYNPVRNKLYSEAVGAGDHAALPDQRQFPPLFPSYLSPLARVLGLKYLATNAELPALDKTLKPDALPVVFRNGETRIYALPDPLPRVLFATSAVVADADTMIRTGVWPQADLDTTVVLTERPAGMISATRPGTARIVRYTNTYVEIEASSPEGGYVVLHDAWHPWWFGYINGDTTLVHRANVLFRAVMLPPGRHKVTFVFRPLRGLATSLIEAFNGRGQP